MMPTLVCEHCTKAIGGDCVGLIPSLAWFDVVCKDLKQRQQDVGFSQDGYP
jgi:hypothetical protein